MGRSALLILAIAQFHFSSALAESPSVPDTRADDSTLLERALQERESDKVARPVGSCIYFCGDQVVETERCPDGDCPAFECYARTKQCPTKPNS